MKLKGKRSLEQVSSKIDKLEALDSKLVEFGSVFKQFLYEDEKNYEAILFVGPQSRIKEHKHVSDNEVYEDLDSHEQEICHIGESHYLENESPDKWLVVRAHKFW